MFFPATFGDEVILDPPYEEMPLEGTGPASTRESIGQFMFQRQETGFT
jgi:hypothetical protein